MRMLVTPFVITYKGALATQLTGWQASLNGDPKRHTAIVRINGRRVVAYSADVRPARGAHDPPA